MSEEGINMIKVDGNVHMKTYIFNTISKCFQLVFTRENSFKVGIAKEFSVTLDKTDCM